MNYDVLKKEVALPQYAGKSDDEVAAMLNTPQFPAIKSRFINARSVLSEISDSAAILDKLEVAATEISAVKWAMMFLQQDDGINIGDPATQAQLDELAEGGILTEDEATALKNMALQNISRAEQLGLGSVNYNDVNSIR